jgi:HSP20 family protein
VAIGYDPFREFDQLAQQLLSGGRAPRSFPMDAYRRGDDFFVHLDLPGVDHESIDVTVEGQSLTITAERRFEHEHEDEIIVKERPQGRFSRELRLSTMVDSGAIEATFEDESSRSGSRWRPRRNHGGWRSDRAASSERSSPSLLAGEALARPRLGQHRSSE